MKALTVKVHHLVELLSRRQVLGRKVLDHGDVWEILGHQELLQ